MVSCFINALLNFRRNVSDGYFVLMCEKRKVSGDECWFLRLTADILVCLPSLFVCLEVLLTLSLEVRTACRISYFIEHSHKSRNT
jgi:hypothetical protein